METLRQEFQSLEMNELHRAVEENRLEAVKHLMNNGANIANTIRNGRTPLHLAVQNKFKDISLELLKNNSREKMRCVTNRRTLDTGTAALHLAVRNNSLYTTRLLLCRGANFEIRDNENRQAKHQTSDKRIIQLIDRIEMVFESIPMSDGKILLEKLNLCSADNMKAVLYARNHQNLSILQLAMEKNHLENVATIVSFRMDKSKQEYWKPCGDIDKLMRHSKAARSHLSNLDDFCHENADESSVDADVKKEVLDLLLNACEFLKAYKERGDVELVYNPSLVTVEEGLEFFGSRKTSKFIENRRVDLMLRKGPEFVAQMLQQTIVAPMQFFMKVVYTSELLEAADKNNLGLVEKFLTGHPDMNKKYKYGTWPLRSVVRHNNSKMLQLLLNFGANPTSPNGPDNRTMLHCICNDSRTEVSLTLLKVLYYHGNFDGIDTQTSSDGFTALHLAAKNGYGNYTQLLLALGAIYCAKDAHDKTPKDYSRTFDQHQIVQWFNTLDQLFAQARDGQIEKLIFTIKGLRGNGLLAFCGARNDEGHTLDQVLELKGHVDEAKQIREMVSKAVWS